MNETAAQKKARLIKLIHIAKGQLMMTDADYRALLANASHGKTGSKALGVAELETVLRQMKAMGFTVMTKARAGGKPDWPVRDAAAGVDGQIKKIRSLWLTLHGLGAVRSPTEAALAKFCKRVTGVDYHGWLDTEQASLVIERLKQWQRRVEHNTGKENHGV